MLPGTNNTSSENLGRTNRRLVLSNILFNQPVSRTEIAKATALTAASVSRITRDLVDAGLVKEQGLTEKPTGPGRRFVELSINPSGGFVLGISINVFQQSVTLTNLLNETIEQVELKLKSLTESDSVIKEVVKAARYLMEKHPEKCERLLGAGVAITGAIDPVQGVIRHAPALKWEDVHLGQILQSELGIPIAVESLPNALNLAENRFSNSKHYRNVLLFNCSLGIGASLYLDGRLIRSTDYTAGLAGSVAYPFGKKDVAVSLDHAAGGWGILTEKEGNGKNLKHNPANEMADRLIDVLKTAEQAEASLDREIIKKSGSTLGKVLALYSGLIHPKAIVLAGPLSQSETYVNAVTSALSSRCGADCNIPELIITRMSNAEATRWLAINEFMTKRDIDLEILKQVVNV